MVQASARQAGERALPAGRLLAGGCPSHHLWERPAELGRAPGLRRGLHARGPRPALCFPHGGLGTWGSYWGSAAAEKASVASAGLSVPPGAPRRVGSRPWGPGRSRLPPSRASLPHSAGRDRWSVLCPPSPPGPPSCPPCPQGGGFGMLHRSSELCFLLFSLVPCHAVGNWMAGLAWARAGRAGLGSGRVQQMLALELRGSQVGGIWVHSASTQV